MNKTFLLGFHVLVALEPEKKLVIKEEQSKNCPESLKYPRFGKQDDLYMCIDNIF